MVSPALTAMTRSPRRAKARSPMVKARPKERIGPMRGEMSMAPMTTATLLVRSPRSAMRLARRSSDR